MAIWIVTPVYRDVASFLILREKLIGELRADEAASGAEVRFVVVDDTAGADHEVKELAEYPDVTVLEPPFNLGHQRALVYAARKLLPEVADADLVVTLDADGEDRPEDLPRLLAASAAGVDGRQAIALAERTKRQEATAFKVMYRCFRTLFRLLTGTTVRTGNYAVMPGEAARHALRHPSFDLAYSSSILALDLPVVMVPCARGSRYQGNSRMTFGKLVMHGLRMLMPFTERIAIRALMLFAVLFGLGVSSAALIAALLAAGAAVPGWVIVIALIALVVSLVALGHFVSLFVLFSQSRAVSLANLEAEAGGEDVGWGRGPLKQTRLDQGGSAGTGESGSIPPKSGRFEATDIHGGV